jgi:predicted  nucleic acid-binding Zn-ribbon protein
MIILLIIVTFLSIAEIVAIVVLAKMFDALNKRFESLHTALNGQVKTLDDQLKPLYERVDKIDDRIPIIVQWCETLRENQTTLQGDMEKAFYGTKKDIRKVEKQQERVQFAEAQKSV